MNASQKPEVQFAQNVSQVFLGMNMKCASCHDSFIDRWTLAETYGLAAVYAERAAGDVSLRQADWGRWPRPLGCFPSWGRLIRRRRAKQRLQRLAELMTDPRTAGLTRTIVNRIWHRLMGRGIVHPVDAMQTEPWSADLLDYLAVDLADQRLRLEEHDSVDRQFAGLSVAGRVRSKRSRLVPDFVYAGPLAEADDGRSSSSMRCGRSRTPGRRSRIRMWQRF